MLQNRLRPSSLMALTQQGPHSVTTISRVAIELGVDENWLWDVVNEM